MGITATGTTRRTVPLFAVQQKLHPTDYGVIQDLFTQNENLPPATATEVAKAESRLYLTLTMDTVAQVDAWAEAMETEVDSEILPDGTWHDEAHGTITVIYDRSREELDVRVYCPTVPHRDVA